MGCLVVLIALFSPRLALALTWIFTPWVDRAFGPIIWPILGIIFLPLTTLLYVILWNTGGRGVTGWEWIVVILALFGDVPRARRDDVHHLQAFLLHRLAHQHVRLEEHVFLAHARDRRHHTRVSGVIDRVERV